MSTVAILSLSIAAIVAACNEYVHRPGWKVSALCGLGAGVITVLIVIPHL